MKDGEHEVAGAVAGEGSAGAIGAMRAGRESKDEQACLFVTESGDRAAPIDLIAVGAPPGFGDGTTVGPETGATFAGDDGLMDLSKCGAGGRIGHGRDLGAREDLGP